MEPLTNSELIAIVNGNMKECSGPTYELWKLACDELKRRIAGHADAQQGSAYHRVDSVFDIRSIELEHKKVMDIVCRTKEAIGSHWSDLDMMAFAVDYRQSSEAKTVIDFFNHWKAKRDENR